MQVWLVNLANNSECNIFNITPVVSAGENDTSWVVTEPANGMLNTTSEVAQVQMTFPKILTKAQTLVMDFEIRSTFDKIPQLLHVTYRVLPGVISNRSVLSAPPGSVVLEAGLDVPFLIDARDAYDNHLSGSMHTFRFTIFRVSSDPKEKIFFEIPSLRYR